MKEDKGKTPLRIILHNFLNHIEKLEASRSPEDSYEKEFQDLKLFSETLKGLKQYSSTEGEKEVNRKKNRYKDILPFDFSRVVLSEYAGTAGSDYINANYIKGASGSPAYIASQGPLPHTVNDFWRMVVECEVHVIIMACNQDEAGKHKCENYWVEREGEVKQFGMVKIRLIQGSTVCPDFSVRTIRLSYTNRESNQEERTVCQFHYSAWPDHGVPPSVRPLLDMVRLVRDTQASETLPVLVHCSAGCGRTGTICAIDYVWGLLRAGKLTKDFSLLTLVREMRRQRVAMVQTTEQYVLVHRAVRELFHEQLRVIDSHPYENIDLNGSLRTSPELENGSEEAKENSNEAPPLPRKNRLHIASSKYEKEVENQTQKERNSQSKQSSPGRPRIAKLKAMFERSPVSRSQSLGRHAAANNPTVLKTPPVLPIKRSKSLRILGYGERSKLSIASSKVSPSPNEVDGGKKPESPSKPTTTTTEKAHRLIVRRRRSFEWNGSSGQPVRRSLHLDDDGRRTGLYSVPPRPENILAGAVGVRERRDSFRQAVSQDAAEARRERERLAAELRARLTLNPPARPMTPRRGPAKPPPPIMSASPNSNVIVVKPDRSSPKPADLYVKSLPSSSLSSSLAKPDRSSPKPADLYVKSLPSSSLSSSLVKPDRSSPKPADLYVKSLPSSVPSVPLVRSYHSLEREVPGPSRPSETSFPSKVPLKKTNSSDNDLYARIGQMRRAITSLDLKSTKNLEVPDALKLRMPLPATPPEGNQTSRSSVKVYESLEKMIRREVGRPAASSSSPKDQSASSSQKDFYSSPRGGPSPQTELYSSPRGGPSPQTEQYSSPRGGPSPQTEQYSSPRGGPSPQTEQYSSPRGGPSPQTEQYSSPRGGPSPQTDHYSSPRGTASPQTDQYSSSKGVPTPPKDRPMHPMYKESDGTSYGLVAGVSIRRGAQDDLALCTAGLPMPPGPVAPPRVKRHASVVLLRHNAAQAAEHSRGPATTPRRSESKATNCWNGPFNIDVDEIADNMRKYSAASPRTAAASHSSRPGAPVHLGQPQNSPSPGGPSTSGFQAEGHRMRQQHPHPQPHSQSHSQASTQKQASVQSQPSHQHGAPQPMSPSQLQQVQGSHPTQGGAGAGTGTGAMSPQVLPSPQHPLPTQHKHQHHLASQRYMSPAQSPHQQPQPQHRLLSQPASPRPLGPHPHPHLHPPWQQLKPPKQLYVQQQPRPKGSQRQSRPTHVHPSPPRNHGHPPTYANAQSLQVQSPSLQQSGAHQSRPALRGYPSQPFPSQLYQQSGGLQQEPVQNPVKKQQYL